MLANRARAATSAANVEFDVMRFSFPGPNSRIQNLDIRNLHKSTIARSDGDIIVIMRTLSLATFNVIIVR